MAEQNGRVSWRLIVDISSIALMVGGGVSIGRLMERVDTLEATVQRMRTERGAVPISVEAATRLTAVEARIMDHERRLERLEEK